MADNKKMVEAITSMDTDFAQWYTDVVKKAELCDDASVMLRRVGETVDSKDAVVKIKDASFPTPFVSALEYNSPVHGNWNIVHTGMQVPESIQIYVCADNCMRGVVLTAPERARAAARR